MSGDRLAEIEAWARDTLSVATINRARDVLALVEIAKAAQEYAECFDQNDVEVANSTATWFELRAALARLDSGAAEEQA